MTAPYGTNISNLDMHATPRAQDDIYGKVVHRTLYNYDSDKGEPVLELAKSVDRLEQRPDPHLQAARRRLLPQRQEDDGGRHHLFVQPHHGRQTRLRGRALRPHHQGRGRGREGAGDRDLGPEEDRRLHAGNDADRAGRSGLLLLQRQDGDLSGRRGRQGDFLQKPIGLGPFKFVEHVPGSRLVAERWEKFYKPGMPYADRS